VSQLSDMTIDGVSQLTVEQMLGVSQKVK